MLVRLLPNQIAEYWPIFKAALIEVAPPIAKVETLNLNRILESALVGRVQCWVNMDEENVADGICCTTFVEDICSDAKFLIIYMMQAIQGKKLSAKTLVDSYETLYKFAQSVKCDGITAYTRDDRIARIFEKLGAMERFKYLVAPIEYKE